MLITINKAKFWAFFPFMKYALFKCFSKRFHKLETPQRGNRWSIHESQTIYQQFSANLKMASRLEMHTRLAHTHNFKICEKKGKTTHINKIFNLLFITQFSFVIFLLSVSLGCVDLIVESFLKCVYWIISVHFSFNSDEFNRYL